MTIHIRTSADLERIREALVNANDKPYDIGRVAEEKCFAPGFRGEPQVRVWGDFEGISVTCGKHLRLLAVRREARRRGIGSELLRDAESRGARIVAAEPGNYFTPGVPESMVPFFAKRGYRETARTFNLVCHSELPKDGEESPLRVQSASGDDRERVLQFIAAEFSPIWRFEAERGPAIFYAEENGRIAGFATHDANNRGLGWFGPTGVSRDFRGRGFGRGLLLASLADLQRLGYHRVVIPWTDTVEFYRKSCGARIAGQFVILQKAA